MILYADDAVLIYAASTPDSRQDAFVLDFKLMCDWYTTNRLSLNVKKTWPEVEQCYRHFRTLSLNWMVNQ